MDLGSINKIPMTKKEENFFFLQRLKNSVGCCLLITGGFFVSLSPVLGVYAVLPVISFWLCGSWLILNLAITAPKLSKEEIENLRWQEYLKGGEYE